MISSAKTLWNRNFSLLIIGQLISIFGNQVLTFALPLYVLQTHESPALFGTILGVSFLSFLVTSPLGGILADRVKKQRIMFWLDVSATIIIVLYMILSGLFPTALVLLVVIKLLALNTIQGFYLPVIEASVPFLAPPDQLTRANSATVAVNTISNMAAPAIAGVLLGLFGLFPILVVSAVCFAATAVIDLLLRIPHTKQEVQGGVLQIVKSDLSEAFRFVGERSILIKIAILTMVVVAVTNGVLMTGIPVFILQHFDMGMEYLGFGRSFSWAGALVGTAIVGWLGERLTIRHVPATVILLALAIVPIGLVLLFDVPVFAAFVVLIVSDFIFTAVIVPYMLAMLTYAQKITPEALVGKVLSLFVALPFFAGGIGYLSFGVLFERFYALSWLIVLISAVLMGLTAIVLRRYFIKAPETSSL